MHTEPDFDGKRAEEAFLSAFDTALGEPFGDENSAACEMSGGLTHPSMVASVPSGEMSLYAFTQSRIRMRSLRQGAWCPQTRQRSRRDYTWVIECSGERI